jgi:hypothetical protein
LDAPGTLSADIDVEADGEVERKPKPKVRNRETCEERNETAEGVLDPREASVCSKMALSLQSATEGMSPAQKLRDPLEELIAQPKASKGASASGDLSYC